ncbi:phage tail tube protein [Lichenifustis flavocetrariae]|uniref:Phage tail tube protein n=1 Tax=Lichenifustis flavocetrariae TaxID=2949735 RepID=A0AA41Z5U1_9HYPH|nr:phage tail tube protein [Lichenifustis flavocetrariae]MCW6509822.1 phage tail tube protein [Lichenifustis flavocetrariae]
MTISSVSKSRVARVLETTFGTTPATPTFLEFRRTSGNLRTKKTTVVSDEIHLDRNVRDEYMTAQDVDGSYAFELAHGSFDDILAAALFGTWTSNVLTNGTTSQSFTFEETVDTGGGTSAYSRYDGVMVSSLSLAIASRSSVKGTLTLMGQQESLDTAIVTGATYTAASTTPIMTANQVANLAIAGISPTPKIKNLTVNVANNLRIRDTVGSLFTQDFGIGPCDVTGTLDAYFESNALYQQVLNHGGGALSATIGGVANQKYTLALPNLRFLDGAKTLSGKNDDVMVSIPFRGLLDTGTGASISITRAVA